MWDDYEEPWKTVAQERQERRERNLRREAERNRDEHLARLSEEERAQFIANEQAQQAAEAAARERALEAHRAELAERHRIERERQTRKARDVVLSVWEVARGHELSARSREKFLAREEVPHLAAFSREDLMVTARISMERDEGDLLLASWLTAAQEREERARQRDLDPSNKMKRGASKLY